MTRRLCSSVLMFRSADLLKLFDHHHCCTRFVENHDSLCRFTGLRTRLFVKRRNFNNKMKLMLQYYKMVRIQTRISDTKLKESCFFGLLIDARGKIELAVSLNVFCGKMHFFLYRLNSIRCR